MIVVPAKGSLFPCGIARARDVVRCVDRRVGMYGHAGSMPERKDPGAVSADDNQTRLKSNFYPYASAEGAEQMRTRSSAASRFGMALHYRCNLPVRGACGGRHAGRRRPSGQCAGTHEKGPPHLSRSCVARVGGHSIRQLTRPDLRILRDPLLRKRKLRGVVPPVHGLPKRR